MKVKLQLNQSAAKLVATGASRKDTLDKLPFAQKDKNRFVMLSNVMLKLLKRQNH